MPWKPFTSASITLEMAQTAALSFAVPTDLPVEISPCVFERLELMPLERLQRDHGAGVRQNAGHVSPSLSIRRFAPVSDAAPFWEAALVAF